MTTDTKASTFNLNDYAFVRLTEEGIRQFEDHYAGLARFGFDWEESLKSHLQPDGEYRFQLHELMLIFGPMCYMGNMDLPFEKNAIRFEPSP